MYPQGERYQPESSLVAKATKKKNNSHKNGTCLVRQMRWPKGLVRTGFDGSAREESAA